MKLKRHRSGRWLKTGLVLALATVPIAGTATEAALKDFEGLVRECETHVASRPERVRQLANGDWVHHFYGPSKVTYDVRKTDSLVAPLLGVLRVEWSEENARRKSEAEAKAATPEGAGGAAGVYEIRFAYQAGRWITSGGSSEARLRLPGQVTFTDPVGGLTQTRESLQKVAWLATCLR